MVEVINLYDEWLNFEPIHRVLFNVDEIKLTEYIRQGFEGTIVEKNNFEDLVNDVIPSTSNFGIMYNKCGKQYYTLIKVDKVQEGLAVAKFQPLLDEYIKNEDVKDFDFIHGNEDLHKLCKNEKTYGILLPHVDKESFFATIDGKDPLPRKSFSMGEPDEKKFYLECRKLFI